MLYEWFLLEAFLCYHFPKPGTCLAVGELKALHFMVISAISLFLCAPQSACSCAV